MDEETPLAGPDARTLRFLKGLVTVLTGTMIVGVLAIVTLLVIRLNAAGPTALPPLPDGLRLPAGAEAAAFTQGKGWVAVVTEDDRILIFAREDGRLIREIAIEPGAAGAGN